MVYSKYMASWLPPRPMFCYFAERRSRCYAEKYIAHLDRQDDKQELLRCSRNMPARDVGSAGVARGLKRTKLAFLPCFRLWLITGTQLPSRGGIGPAKNGGISGMTSRGSGMSGGVRRAQMRSSG